jgi:hypothetical protein
LGVKQQIVRSASSCCGSHLRTHRPTAPPATVHFAPSGVPLAHTSESPRFGGVSFCLPKETQNGDAVESTDGKPGAHPRCLLRPSSNRSIVGFFVNTRRRLTPPQVRPIQLISCGYSAWQRSQRLHLSQPPHEAQKTALDQTLRSKRQGINIARDFTPYAGPAPRQVPGVRWVLNCRWETLNLPHRESVPRRPTEVHSSHHLFSVGVVPALGVKSFI